MIDIPKDKNYPAGAGQCDGCGGHGCEACQGKGWLAAGHPGIRRCEHPHCSAVLAPDHVAVYCTNECAAADA